MNFLAFALKECIRRIYFAMVWAGLADEEFEATTGTWKHRFAVWLYGDGAPIFDTQIPDEDDTK